MRDETVTDRVRWTALVLARRLRQFGFAARRPLRSFSDSPQPYPDRLIIAPQDIRTADPTVADDIYSGYFVFDGKAVSTRGVSPFEIEPPSEAWAASLAGFGWLRHLRAAETALARVNARALVGDWIATGRLTGARPDVMARRLLSWLSQSPSFWKAPTRSSTGPSPAVSRARPMCSPPPSMAVSGAWRA